MSTKYSSLPLGGSSPGTKLVILKASVSSGDILFDKKRKLRKEEVRMTSN